MRAKSILATRGLVTPAIVFLSFLSLVGAARAQQVAGSSGLSQPEIDRITTSFTAKETQFRTALNQYSFKRDAIVQSLGMGGQVIGEYHRVSFFTFDDQGNRY